MLMENQEIDATEAIRRVMIEAQKPGTRAALEAEHGEVWDTEELGREFEVIGFSAPFVVVIRKSDGVKGFLQFQHSPRLYWGFEAA
jgi:hypothetical protein